MGLAFVNVNILVAASAIGLATTVMVTIGVMLGRVLGTVVGKRAEINGGIVLMLVARQSFTSICRWCEGVVPQITPVRNFRVGGCARAFIVKK